MKLNPKRRLAIILGAILFVLTGYSLYLVNSRFKIIKYSADIPNQAVCGNQTCDAGESTGSCPVDCLTKSDFVFSNWPIHTISAEEQNVSKILSQITGMEQAGMNYAGIAFRPDYKQIAIDKYINPLRAQGFKLALETSVGTYSWGGPPELRSGQDDSEFLNPPSLNKDVCENWNSYHAIDPTYTGILWQNSINSLREVVTAANPEIVLVDTEIWTTGQLAEYYFNNGDPGRNCGCQIVKDSIGYENYIAGKQARYQDIINTIKAVRSDAQIYFYSEMPEGAVRWGQDAKGDYVSSTSAFVEPNTGTSPSPALYILPNLELLEKNAESIDLRNSVPWISFSHMSGYSNYTATSVYSDPSVSREAGRILRKAGAKGFLVYLNAYNLQKSLDGAGTQYWLEHSKAMTDGFNEGLTYVEKNKVSNPSFEAFKSKAGAYVRDAEGKGLLTGDQRFVPVFWTMKDSIEDTSDLSQVANIDSDKSLGRYSWRQSLLAGATRTITNRTFNVSKKGKYKLNLDARSAFAGKISAYLSGSGENIPLIDENTQVNWSTFGQEFDLEAGDYSFNIQLSDVNQPVATNLFLIDRAQAAGERTDFYLDNISLAEVVNPCGNSICDSGENSTTCPADCPNVILEKPPTSTNTAPVITSINTSEGQVIVTRPYIIVVKAEDDKQVKKASFYVDDVLIGENSSPDLDGNFEYPWIPGETSARIKVVVEDEEGLTSEISRNVSVGTLVQNRSLLVLPKTGKP